MLEREESEILQMAALFEIIHEPAQERDSSIGVHPGIDIAGGPLKSGTSQGRLGNQLVDGLRELYVQSGVIFRKHALSIRFLAHLDP